MAASAVPAQLMTALETVTRQGVKYDNDDSPSNQYYGFLAQIERAQYKAGGPVTYSAQFEIAPLEWVETAVMSLPEKTRELPPVAPSTLLVFDELPLEELADYLGVPPEGLVEGDWFIITLGNGAKASRSKGTYPSVSQAIKARGFKSPAGKQRQLRQRYQPRGIWLVRVIRRLLVGVQPREVGVMDVGAGSCNLIYDENGSPQVYVDVGLPMWFNNGSRPPPPPGQALPAIVDPGPCLDNNPPGILTHFHWDHYFMLYASANLGALRNRDWIMPNQFVGFYMAAIIAGIGAAPNGAVHVFPAGLAAFPAGHIQLIQCLPGAGVPADAMNDTGIAVVARVVDPAGYHVLLPGDAVFQSIPGLAAFPNLRYMTAYHHGSDHFLIAAAIPAPNVANGGRIAYSYGIDGPVPGGVHVYGHPRAAAVAAYHAAGWGTVAATEASTAETGPNSNIAGRGNIMMANNVIPPNHGPPNCPFHHFPKIMV